MEYTDFQKELVREIQRLSVNTRYPQFFSIDMNTYLLGIVETRKQHSR